MAESRGETSQRQPHVWAMRGVEPRRISASTESESSEWERAVYAQRNPTPQSQSAILTTLRPDRRQHAGGAFLFRSAMPA
jgi:hypothetical protein